MVLASEALLPDCIQKNITEQKITLYVQASKGKWLGMTYKDDLLKVKQSVEALKRNQEYPEHLWR